MSTCNAIGYLVVGNARVGLLRCTEPAGHTEERPCDCVGLHGDDAHGTHEATPHAAKLEWTNDGDPLDWPEALDPDEDFDVEVDAIDGQPVNGDVSEDRDDEREEALADYLDRKHGEPR